MLRNIVKQHRVNPKRHPITFDCVQEAISSCLIRHKTNVILPITDSILGFCLVKVFKAVVEVSQRFANVVRARNVDLKLVILP